MWANSPWGETGSYPTKYTNTFISMKSIIKYNLQTQFVVLEVRNETITALSPGEKIQ